MNGFLKAPNPKKKESKPFLLELLLGISLIVVVGLVIYMTLNPRKGEEEVRNSERSQVIVEIAAAVKKYVDATGNIVFMFSDNACMTVLFVHSGRLSTTSWSL